MKKICKIIILLFWIILLTGCDLFGEESIKVTIDYNCDGINEYKCSTIDDKLNCIIVMPECKGYSFVGWYDAKTSGNEVNLDADFTKNTTIYAVWEEDGSPKSKTSKKNNPNNKPTTVATYTSVIKSYTISFNLNGGSGNNPSSVKVKVDEIMPSIDKNIPTKTNYTFMGWYDNKNYTLGKAYYNERNEPSRYYDKKKNITLYAGWKENKVEKPQVVEEQKYQITFNLNGGRGSTPVGVKVKYNEIMPQISKTIPGRKDYKFTGWYDNSDYTKGKLYYNELNEPAAYFNKKSNITLYAGWSKEIVILSYKIIFNSNGGTGGQENPVMVKTGEDLPKITNNPPKKDGYTFLGWYDDVNNGKLYYNEKGVAQIKFDKSNNITLFAHYKANKYTISFNSNNGTGSIPSSVTATYASIVPTINKNRPTRSGYTFLGWYDNSDYTKGSSYYSANNESVLKYNKTSNITLYAGWSKNAEPTYVVTFNQNGGTGGQTANVSVKKGAAMPAISTIAPKKNGYTFIGWYDALSGGTKYYNSNCSSAKNYDKNSGITLYARYNPISYNISYNLNGGTISNPSSAKYDEVITINNPTKTFTVTIDSNNSGASISSTSASSKQTFLGWTASNNLDTANAKYGSTTSTSNSWTIASSKIADKYFKNLMSKNDTITLTANWKQVDISLPSISKSGYTCGFSTSATGSIIYASSSKYTPSISANSAKIYAICTKTTYTVSFNANGGSGGQSASVSVSYGDAMPSISSTKPTRSDYTFAGWYDAQSGGKQYYTEDNKSARNYDKTSNTTLYAHWNKKGTTLKVASFNIGYFSCGSATTPNCLNEYSNHAITSYVINTVKSENIDLMGFQEARDNLNAACKNNGGYCYFNRVRCGYEFNYMICILRGLGIDTGNSTDLNNHFVHSCPANADASYSKITVDTSKTKTYNLGSSRTIDKLVLSVNGVQISFYNTHLGLNSDNATHYSKLAEIVNSDSNPVIITGDFNYSGIERYNNYLKPIGFVIAAHDDSGQSMNTRRNHTKDDYMDSIYVRPYGSDKVNHISIISSKTLVTFDKYSDHNLIIATLSVY